MDIKAKESLSDWTTLGIGGKSDIFYVARKPQDLVRAISIARRFSIPTFVLGGGSNLLMSDKGFRGLTIKNQCRKIEVDGNRISCQSGALLKDLVLVAKRSALTGLEFAAGIWGTVGGAVYGNAGAFGRSMADVLEGGVVVGSGGDIKKVAKSFFEFDYRRSKLRASGDILLSAVFKLKNGNREKIEDKTKENLAQRRIRVPQRQKTAGCYFRNPQLNGKTVPAGRLLEEIGAKELSIGDAGVYSKHANILVNSGKARAKDMRRLADILKKRVKRRFGVNLEEEVVFLGST